MADAAPHESCSDVILGAAKGSDAGWRAGRTPGFERQKNKKARRYSTRQAKLPPDVLVAVRAAGEPHTPPSLTEAS